MQQITTNVTETENKRRFAVELLKSPSDPFKAALAVFAPDTGTAMAKASVWPSDPEVKGYMTEALEEVGDMHFLPGKADLSRAIWDIVANNTLSVDDRLKAMRLYGDLRGFIEKQGTIINNNNNMTSNKVMLVKSHESNEAWEQKLVQQQQGLIADATKSITH